MASNRPLDTQSILEVHDEVELRVGSGEQTRLVRAQVWKLLPDGLMVALPEEAQDLAASPEPYSVQVTRSGKDAVFVLDTRRIVPDAPATSLLILKQEGEWRRVQRRWDVRWRISLDGQVRVSAAGGDKKTLGITILDISAGGLLIQSKQRLVEGERVTVLFQLPGQPASTIETDAEVVRGVPVEESSGIFRTGLQFLALPERERERIVKFIFQTQARARRMGYDRPRHR